MAANTVYVDAGLLPSKTSTSPDAGVNTVYISAGIPPAAEEAGETIYPQQFYGSRNMTPLLQM